MARAEPPAVSITSIMRKHSPAHFYSRCVPVSEWPPTAMDSTAANAARVVRARGIAPSLQPPAAQQCCGSKRRGLEHERRERNRKLSRFLRQLGGDLCWRRRAGALDHLNDGLGPSRSDRDSFFRATSVALSRRRARSHHLGSHSIPWPGVVVPGSNRLYGSQESTVNVGNLIPLHQPGSAV